ncbi:unnamed protein product, partial [Heterotrigona itama]
MDQDSLAYKTLDGKIGQLAVSMNRSMSEINKNIETMLKLIEKKDNRRGQEIVELANKFIIHVNMTDDSSQPGTSRNKCSKRLTIPGAQKATTLIRTIKTLKGQDDLGVEDFIQDIRDARLQCNDKHMLLKLILSEKITGQAERSISFEELYDAFRTHVTSQITISTARAKLANNYHLPNEN